MGVPEGFTWARRGDGEVVITHHGTVAGVLRGAAAATFLARVAGLSDTDAQHLMARRTGNYRRGNERAAASHPRRRR